MKSLSAVQKIGAFLLAFALFYLLGLAKAAPDMAPLSIGLYCALIYCRKNYFAVSIAFIGGVCAAGHDLISLIDACSAALVFGVALAIHFKAALPLRIAHAAIYAFLSMLPRFFLGLFLRGIVLQGVCFLVVNTVFCICACIGLYAFFVRGTGTGLAYDETLGLLLLAAGLGLGAYQAELWGYRPFFTVLCALCCAGAYAFPPLAGAGICASFALGGATATGEAGILGAAVAIWAGGALFCGQGKWFCALACEGVYLLSGYVLHAFEYFDTLNICLASAGIAAVALIPSSLLKGLGKRLFPPAYSAALYAAERERRELFDKLGGSARLFLAMAQEFEKQAPEKPKVKSVCADVAAKVCARCKEREKCLDLAGEQAFERAAERALEGKETDAEDLPLFIIGKCAGLDELLQAFSASARAAERAEKRRETAQENGRAIAAQMRGMAAVLGRLATSISRVGGGDERAARELISELGYVNVVCRAAAVTGSGQELKVTLRLREGDEEKKAVEKVVSRLMKKKMALRECVRGEGTATLVFAPAPAYMLACGSAGCVKEGSNRAGDVSAVTDVGEGMVLASVCDGMGSGGEAAEESRACFGRACSGDRPEAVAHVSRMAGIDETRCECRPEDKIRIIREFQAAGSPVCMVGDGVNDAPALRAAHAGIAMGAVGSDIAVESADIVLVGDDIGVLPHLFALSRRMMRTIKLNMAFSMALNFAAIALAAAGILHPVAGALVHNAGSVLVIINSSLLLKWKGAA